MKNGFPVELECSKYSRRPMRNTINKGLAQFQRHYFDPAAGIGAYFEEKTNIAECRHR